MACALCFPIDDCIVHFFSLFVLKATLNGSQLDVDKLRGLLKSTNGCSSS